MREVRSFLVVPLAFAANDRSAWVVVFVLAARGDRDHTRGGSGMCKGKAVRTPLDQHHKKERHGHNGVRSFC